MVRYTEGRSKYSSIFQSPPEGRKTRGGRNQRSSEEKMTGREGRGQECKGCKVEYNRDMYVSEFVLVSILTLLF